MGEPTFTEKVAAAIKHIVYVVVLPIYLWSIGCETLEEYITEIEQQSPSGQNQSEYRDHLRFVYRWVSRMNGDKPHDKPDTNWKTYVSAIVNYPLSPWQTGDWFED